MLLVRSIYSLPLPLGKVTETLSALWSGENFSDKFTEKVDTRGGPGVANPK